MIPEFNTLRKENLISAIIERIDNLLCETCDKCKQFYSIGREDTPTVLCSHCGQGGHESCYHEVGAILREYPGLQYYCSRCKDDPEGESDSPVTDVAAEVTAPRNRSLRHGSPVNDVRAIDTNSHPRSSRRRIDSDNLSDLQEEEENLRPICQKLRRGVCPHGISGLNKIDNQICQFRHLKRCQPFCKYGRDAEEGCDKGRDCNLLHPILCKYSLEFKLCTNRRCRYTHLTGTRRYKPRDQHDGDRSHNRRNDDNYHHSQSNYNDHRERSFSRNNGRYTDDMASLEDEERYRVRPEISYSDAAAGVNQRSQPAARSENTNVNTGISTQQMTFLSQMMTQMKEVQQEMKEFRQLYKPPIPPAAWIRPAAPPPVQMPQNQGPIQFQQTPIPMHMVQHLGQTQKQAAQTIASSAQPQIPTQFQQTQIPMHMVQHPGQFQKQATQTLAPPAQPLIQAHQTAPQVTHIPQ